MPIRTKKEKIKAGYTRKFSYVDPTTGETIYVDELSDNVTIYNIDEDPGTKDIVKSKNFTEVRDLSSGKLLGYEQIMNEEYYNNDYMKENKHGIKK